ncbi:EcsC protein family protein [Paenibacillus sophorae]|uniref:EcsC family protein n=1 Tax=Paenibacillus sophorae TaxID=1333845 RepID=A0A1H8IV85_9BACL|nr:EcsC family protein [Paenibacillus sophorae]QWU16093.1 EcsC family protein [Paenibacillus sophorae]SEN72351.1 EcsC protein family protein [Paenibacillus sophorae]
MTEITLGSGGLETQEELRAALEEVRSWEKEQRQLMIWERLTRLPFKLLDKITPRIVHEKIGLLLDELGGYIQNGGNYLVAGRKVGELMNEVSREAGGKAEGPYPLAVMDEAARRLSKSRSNYATAQGATTGFGGVFTLAADIPAILGLSLKVIQEIGLCYGYNPLEKEERIFAVKVMQLASSETIGKRAILEELNLELGRDGGNFGGEGAAVSKIQGWREVIAAYRDNWSSKKLLQMIPVAGMLFGAYTNREMLKGVSEAARMLYRKRRILDRLMETGETPL